MSSTAYLETRVLSADPIELIHIMYEHAILALDEARRRLVMDDIAGRSRAVSKCIAIVGELEASLNFEAGGGLCQELGRLYEYVKMQLTLGNLEQNDERFSGAEEVLKNLAEGWNAIRPSTLTEKKEPAGTVLTPDFWHSNPVPDAGGSFSVHTWCA